MIRLLSILVGSFLVLSSCTTGHNYIEEKKVSSKWTYTDDVTFSVPEKWSQDYATWNIGIRHNTDYSNKNVYVRITAKNKAGTQQWEDIVSLELANKQGAWMGQCKNNSCLFSHALSTDKYPLDTGGVIQVSQYTRDTILLNIESVNFSF